MALSRSTKQPTIGRVIKNHATQRVEVRKDPLYSFVVPTFEGWNPPQDKERATSESSASA